MDDTADAHAGAAKGSTIAEARQATPAKERGAHFSVGFVVARIPTMRSSISADRLDVATRIESLPRCRLQVSDQARSNCGVNSVSPNTGTASPNSRGSGSPDRTRRRAVETCRVEGNTMAVCSRRAEIARSLGSRRPARSGGGVTVPPARGSPVQRCQRWASPGPSHLHEARTALRARQLLAGVGVFLSAAAGSAGQRPAPMHPTGDSTKQLGFNSYVQEPCQSPATWASDGSGEFTELKSLGANSVALAFPIYMSGITSNTVFASGTRRTNFETPSTARLSVAIKEAHALGLTGVASLLQELQLVKSPSGSWVGHILLSGCGFKSYLARRSLPT